MIRRWLGQTLIALVLCTGAVHAQTFTVTPAAGEGPRTISWNVPSGTNCQAGGDWSGTKAASGTETVTPTGGAHTYTLTCTVPGTPVKGSALVKWTPPTQNTDGSPLNTLKAFELHYGRNSTALDRMVALQNPGTTSYRVENLDDGRWYFAVKAVSTTGTSGLSNVANKLAESTPSTQPWTGTQTISVSVAPPSAPVLTVE